MQRVDPARARESRPYHQSAVYDLWVGLRTHRSEPALKVSEQVVDGFETDIESHDPAPICVVPAL